MTPVGQGITEMNPVGAGYNIYSGVTTGNDMWGNPMGAGGYVSAGLTFIPGVGWVKAIGRAGNIVNRFGHIFGKAEHALGSLVLKFGSEEKAFLAVQDAANAALKAGKLTPNSKGILRSGDMGDIIDVGGMSVRLIGGKVENGIVIISSFSRKGL